MIHEEEIIRASEIGQYAFCARAWWYSRVKGYAPENTVELEQGVVRHRHHGRQVRAYHQLRWMGLGLLLPILAGLKGKGLKPQVSFLIAALVMLGGFFMRYVILVAGQTIG